MNEARIQNLLYAYTYQKGHRLIVPNCGVNGWEADLLSVTKKDFVYEYEIKISKVDFKSDAKKRHKHRCLIGIHKNQGIRRSQNYCPNFFYYVLHFDGASEISIPDHSGLMVINPQEHYIEVIKKAPRLHDGKMPDRTREYLERGLVARYWKERIKNGG